MKKFRKILFRTSVVLLALGVAGMLALLTMNWIVTGTTKANILSEDAAAQLQDIDCILVLGCKVHANGSPSDMLHDRLRRGVALYDRGAAQKLLMSGDHGQTSYDEVNTMKQFAMDAGIPSSDIFMDHAGFSTYESLYRAKEIFGVEKSIIVTQEYHLYRAIYIAEQLGMEAYGVDADYRSYWGQTSRDIREVLARAKDLVNCIFMPEPTYGGETIPISGDGDVTND